MAVEDKVRQGDDAGGEESGEGVRRGWRGKVGGVNGRDNVVILQ